MDIFKFTNPTDQLKMEQGEIINGLTSKTWIERYDVAGEFTLVADANAGMKEKLPAGTFVSHVDTPEIMIVENHEVTEDPDQPSEMVITGRGFETFFENRIVGSNRTFPVNDGVSEYQLAADYIWNQAVTLLKKHLFASELLDDGDALSYLEIMSDVAGTGESVARSVKMGPLHQRFLELLGVGDLGVKVVRPGLWSPAVADENTVVVVHIGTDRTDQIVFSQDTGEIDNSQYLWSNKRSKNAALVTGRWVQTTVVPGDTGINRRWMLVDASDLDQNLSAVPTGTTLTNIVTAMQRRGMEALAAQSNIVLTRAEVSKNTNKSAYRKDFFVGDLITVNGSYHETSTMRVSEYVEIEDKNGAQGYPTLTAI